jgi:hypothetical protein|tara:strand:+ start:888 stop:1130 length:243 start_codon:yes stop_codon:yes gene_type:complete
MINYKSLKSSGKVSVKKEDDEYKLVKKNWDKDTGESLDDSIYLYVISNIENTISSIQKDIDYLTNKKADYEQLKTDFEAL